MTDKCSRREMPLRSLFTYYLPFSLPRPPSPSPSLSLPFPSYPRRAHTLLPKVINQRSFLFPFISLQKIHFLSLPLPSRFFPCNSLSLLPLSLFICVRHHFYFLCTSTSLYLIYLFYIFSHFLNLIFFLILFSCLFFSFFSPSIRSSPSPSRLSSPPFLPLSSCLLPFFYISRVDNGLSKPYNLPFQIFVTPPLHPRFQTLIISPASRFLFFPCSLLFLIHFTIPFQYFNFLLSFVIPISTFTSLFPLPSSSESFTFPYSRHIYSHSSSFSFSLTLFWKHTSLFYTFQTLIIPPDPSSRSLALIICTYFPSHFFFLQRNFILNQNTKESKKDFTSKPWGSHCCHQFLTRHQNTSCED